MFWIEILNRLPWRESRGRGAKAIALFLVLALWGEAGAQTMPVQGYVSGHLLATWCKGATPLDNEACLSYLRGVFDILNADGYSSIPGGAGDRDGSAALCIPAIVPVTELRILYSRYALGNPDKLGNQASVLMLEVLGERFPCPPTSE